MTPRTLLVMALVLLTLMLAASCAPSRLPPPDVRPTLLALDRIEGRILTHELTTARWRCHGTR